MKLNLNEKCSRVLFHSKSVSETKNTWFDFSVNIKEFFQDTNVKDGILIKIPGKKTGINLIISSLKMQKKLINNLK